VELFWIVWRGAANLRLNFFPTVQQRNTLLIRLVPVFIAVAVMLFQRCSSETITNEAGRKVRLGLSQEQEATLGLQSYKEVLQTNRTITSGPQYEMVKRCAERLAGQTGEAGRNFQWAVSLVESPQVNAFCLPGGKICVYTGILPVAQTEAGLAVVMGHEMAHATLRHGSERVFQQKQAQTLMSGVNFSLGDLDPQQRRAVMGAIGAGAQYGYLLPFGRDHESEADSIGLTYMAKAGYDPREAVTFWQRMGQASGGKAPPEFMSTHPSHETRISRLKEMMPKAMELYKQAGGR
jgi:predicted Zn-dependent protease